MVNTSRLVHTTDVIASDELRALFSALREAYDYVIVDLSPVAPSVDVRAAAPLLDAAVFVVEWGRTNIDVVKDCLDIAGGIYDKMLGITLNKVNTRALRRYGRTLDMYYSRHHARRG